MTATETPAEPVGGLVNFRDLGGLPAANGRTTRAGVLYRSAAVLSAAEIPPESTAWPPALVVDLRGPTEWVSQDGRHPLVGLGTASHSMPMIDGGQSGWPTGRPGESMLAALYRQMLGVRGPRLVELVQRLGEIDGPALVHCAAGKDRTGVVVAVLLSAAEVEPAAIVADYQRTLPHMPAIMARHATAPVTADAATPGEATRAVIATGIPAGVPDELLGTPTDAIEAVLAELDAHPDGAAGWLADHGLPAADLDRWRQRLLG